MRSMKFEETGFGDPEDYIIWYLTMYLIQTPAKCPTTEDAVVWMEMQKW